MPDKTVPVTSLTHFNTLLSGSTYVVVDFYADWCGPCKTIAPIFNSLAEKETKQGRLQFAKVNVDTQQEVARKFGVSAMPTFLVLKNSSVVETIRGANSGALTAAVRKAANDCANGPAASGVHFKSKGHTLGSADKPGGPAPASGGSFAGLQGMLSGNGGLGDVLVRFLALYFVSLFALDAYHAAEESPFAIRRRR